MKGYFKRYFIFFTFFAFSFITIRAQESRTSELATMFISELEKGGITLPRSAVQLEMLESTDKQPSGLSLKTPDAFHLAVADRSLKVSSHSVEGIRNGLYWYLNYLGYRYYFPNPIWHYVPKLSLPLKNIQRTVHPSFTSRRIWYAYGTGSKKADADYQRWYAANLQGGEEVNAGHAYEAIVNRNKAVFQQHPEFFAQKVAPGTIPKNPKFEVGDERLVQLVIQDALSQISTSQKKTGKLPAMLSMDPSDGGGFSTSQSSLKIGGPSEQAFYLANRVASEVRKKYPLVRIGLYAYNLHAAPPSFALEPNIVVLLATAMNQSEYRTDELIALWGKKGIQVGIRDYFGVLAWDWDMPGRVKGGRLAYVRQLKNYFATGVRYFSAETNIGWISRGVGHYIAAQLLWNKDADVKELEAEFYTSMFGRASDDVKKVFQSWQTYSQEVPLDGDLFLWSQWIDQASKKEDSKAVQERIDQIKQYLHFVVLFKQWKEQGNDASLVDLLSYAYRTQDGGHIASYPLFRRLANSAVAGKKNMRFDDPKAVWKSNNEPVGHAETERNFNTDRTSFDKSEKFDVQKLPAEFKLSLTGNRSATSAAVRLRGSHKIILQIQGSNTSINLSQGLIKSNKYKSLRIKVFPYNSSLATEGVTPIITRTIEPSQPLLAVSLDVLKLGTYIVEIDDARDGFTMSFSGSLAFSIYASPQNKLWTFGRNNLSFYVDNVKSFRVINEGVLTLISPIGRTIDLQKQKGNFEITVEKGEIGIWRMQRQSGRVTLQGILPLVNADPSFLLH